MSNFSRELKAQVQRQPCSRCGAQPGASCLSLHALTPQATPHKVRVLAYMDARDAARTINPEEKRA